MPRLSAEHGDDRRNRHWPFPIPPQQPDRMSDVTTTLITGGTRGLGRETARRLCAAGQNVYTGARTAEAGKSAADDVGSKFLVLDVTDDAGVRAAVQVLAGEIDHLDVLINNAGIGGATKSAGEMTADEVRDVYETNVFGVVRVTHAFLPLLQAGPAPLVVNVSSGLASLELAADLSSERMDGPYLAYGSSKAALNMLTVQYARALPEVRFLAVNPGYTATGLTGFNGTQTVEEGSEVIVQAALNGGAAPTASFVSRDGRFPW